MAKTRVLLNGKIYTVNKAQPWAEAVVIVDNKIAYVGDNEGAKAYVTEGVVPEDLNGRLMLPGLIDGHTHPFMAIAFASMMRFYPDQDLDGIKETIRKYMQENPDMKAYMGMGWADTYFGEVGPNKKILDEICPDKPMVLLSSSGHCGWANSKALEVAHVDASTPDPDAEAGQLYVRDKDGNPTGYIKECTCMNHVLGAYAYIDESKLGACAENFAKQCSELGLTALHDCGNYEFCEYLINDDLIEVMESEDCPLRIDLCGYVGNKANMEVALKESIDLHQKFHSDRLRATFVKILNDGTLENFSAAMPGVYPDERTVAPTMNTDELVYWGEKAAKAGLDMNVHAIGSLTVRGVLEAAGRLRAMGYNAMRITCSHSAYVFPEDIELFKKYNVLANSTARWFGMIPDLETEKFVSTITRAMPYPMKSILKAGGKISFSSDFPTDMTTFLPMPNFEVALTRQLVGEKDSFVNQKEERLTLEEVIEAYTINNAWQMHMEDKIGSIEVGKYADLVVFEQNLFEVDPYAMHDVLVHETIMDGLTRFKRA